MTKEELIEFAKGKLESLYKQYKPHGIESIYIWGSITRPDFDIQTSDIDVICIVRDEFPLELNEQLRDELTMSASDREWGFQIIYLSELNGGPLRSRLVKAMSPQSILPSFSNWVYVSGKDFKRSDFSVPDASITERMKLNIEEIRRRLGSIPSDDDYKKGRDRKGVVKAALLLMYNRQLQRGEKFDLDYNELKNHCDDQERPVLQVLLNIKHDSIYDDRFSMYISAIENFAAVAEKELA
jgi:predicted nucleotidyltransferase